MTSLPASSIHPCFMKRNSHRICHSKVARCLHTLEDNCWWQFLSISRNCLRYGETCLLPTTKFFWRQFCCRWIQGSLPCKRSLPRSMRSTDVLVWQTDGTSLFVSLNCSEDTVQGLFFVRRLMQWQRFHFWYQPRDALKSGSLAFNCGMKRPIKPIEPLG